MEWQVITALIIAIPIILFPAAFIWYLDISGIVAAARMRRAARRKITGELVKVTEHS
jgi:hypothetical protein